MNNNSSSLKYYEFCQTKKPKYLVVFLHGYGANGQNLISLADDFSEVINDGFFISPNANEPWEGGFPNSYQWFSLYQNNHRKTLNDLAEEIRNANKILKNFLNEQLQKLALDLSKLILIGFSQGSMMANYQAMIANQPLAGVISFSGRIIEPTSVGDKIISKTKTCLIHGQDDSVLDFSNFIEAKKILERLAIPFEAHALDNLDHSIDLRCIDISKKFLKSLIN